MTLPHLLPPSPADRLAVALDFPSAARALDFVDRLDGSCRWFKVGLELYCAAGNRFIDLLIARDLKVFLDLKLHDIPNTVAGAIRAVSGTGASLLTIHASGGENMLRAAAETVAGIEDAPRLLAVTVLTSMDPESLRSTGIDAPMSDQVLRLARFARTAGINGLVCSAEELAMLRQDLGSDPLLVVPGIRPHGAASADQQRIATPAEAIQRGASMLVVGRPITQAADPAGAARAILREIVAAG